MNQYVLAMNLRRWIGQNEKHRIQRFDPSGSLVAYRLVMIQFTSTMISIAPKQQALQMNNTPETIPLL